MMERYANIDSCKLTNSDNAYLRKVLNNMFPSNYLKLYHQPPNTVCSLLKETVSHQNSIYSRCFKNQNQQQQDSNCCLIEASTEPSSRSNIVNLRKSFDETLIDHQAKPVGLCPIRRSIYDQCFDELIREVTVGCIEQGLLLFRIRNELRMTLNYYKKAYESGVEFGLNKAIEAEMILNNNNVNVRTVPQQDNNDNDNDSNNNNLRNRISDIELKNKLESVDRMKEYYKVEITKRDQVIEQQRATIKALAQKYTSSIKSPII